jgi:hypothetical protein
MERLRFFGMLCATSALLIFQASGQNLHFNFSGTFDATAPTTTVSAPNTAFDLQFTLPQNISSDPTFFSSSTFFSVIPTSETYQLGDNAPITFVNIPQANNIFEVAKSGSSGGQIEIGGPYQQYFIFFLFSPTSPIYSGPLSNPKIIRGTYFPNTNQQQGIIEQDINGSYTVIGNPLTSNDKLVISRSAVPEPSTLSMIFVGLVASFGYSILLFRNPNRESAPDR